MTDLNNFQSNNLSQFFDSVKFRSRSGSGYHLVIDFCIVMFYMLMILMKFSFVPQTFVHNTYPRYRKIHFHLYTIGKKIL